jgi:hypothetical protein
MISKLSFAPKPSSRRTLVSADGAAWRIKPEVRTLALIIERTRRETTNPFGGTRK